MNKKSCIIYDSWGKLFTNLSDEMAGQLIKAIVGYTFDQTAPATENQAVIAMFSMIKDKIDEDMDKYQEKVSRVQRAREKKSDRNQDEINTDINHEISSVSDSDSVSVSVSDSVSVSESVSDSKRESTPNGVRKRAHFVPPTLEEVRAYCIERGSSVDPERFFEYFDSGGWTDSRGQKVKNWKQKLITWESHGNGTRAAPAWGERDIVSEWMNA